MQNYIQNKVKRVPIQVHTRKLDRMVARRNMKKQGMVHINKDGVNGRFFAKSWIEYVTV